MTVTSAQPSSGGIPSSAPLPAPSSEACPLCGAPLHPEQGWCLACGAAARTRLSGSPGWKGPIGAFAVVLVLALGVLAAALVDLAGGSGAPAPTVTTTVTTPAALAPTTSTAATSTATTPGARTPGASQPGASTSPTSTGAAGGPKVTPKAKSGIVKPPTG